MGSLRLFLAILVVLAHARNLAPFPFFPGLPVPWYDAIWVFYCFSGFYMALILNLKYTKGYTLYFYANRWLRIWPMYLGALLFLGILVLKTGVVCSMTCIDVHFLGRMLTFLPEGWRAAIIGSNLFLFGLDAQWALDFPLPLAGESQEFVRLALYDKFNTNGPYFSLISPAWTIGVELLFYAMAPFIVRSLKKTIIATVFFAAIHLWLGLGSLYFSFFFAPSVLAFFFIGALTWHIAHRLPNFVTNRRWQIATFLWCYAWWLLADFNSGNDPAAPLNLYSYATVIGILPLFPVLLHLTSRSRIDRFFADYSYPLFILHGPIFIYALWAKPVPEGWPLTLFILSTSLVAGLIGYWLIERPVSHWRRKWTEEKVSQRAAKGRMAG